MQDEVWIFSVALKAWFPSESGNKFQGRLAVVLSRASGLAEKPVAIDNEGHISLCDIDSLISTGRPIHCLEKDRHLLDLSSSLPGRGVSIIVASEVPADLRREFMGIAKEFASCANTLTCNICENNPAPIAPDGRLCVCKGIQKIPGFNAAFAVALTYFTSAFCHKKKQ